MEQQELYENGYRSEHSSLLREKFENISNRYVDWFNDKNVAIEFKECFTKKEEQAFFKVYLKEVKRCHFVVFSYHHEEFFIENSQFLLDAYSFNTYENRCNLRINTLRKQHMFKTNDIDELERFLKEELSLKQIDSF